MRQAIFNRFRIFLALQSRMNALKKSQIWVDLHTHSHKSDGTLSPADIVKLAVLKGLAYLSITDHDTVAGSREAREFLSTSGENRLRLISGIEISAKYPNGTLHILGYHINLNHEPLLNELSELKLIRRNRNIEIIDRLHQQGIHICKDDLKANDENNDSQGRPHIARILMDKKIVNSIDQAFNEFLGKNKKAYVPKELFTADKAIEMIHHSGGKAVIAHPATLNLRGTDFDDYLDKLVDIGLDGIEVYAPLHSIRQINQFRKAAKKRNLLISAGSDFHGSIKPKIELGLCSAGKTINAGRISKQLTTVSI